MDRLVKPSQAPDEASEWLQRIGAAADKQAFVQLFNYFAPRVKAYLRRQGLAPDAAEDLTQDIMLQIWKRAGQFDGAKARASTWIFTIARNRLIDSWRKNKNAAIPTDDFSQIEEPAYEPQQGMDAEREGKAVREAVQHLPQAQRELVEDSFFQDRSHHMIAEARKIPLGTVKSRLRLALARLRKNINEEGT